MKKKLLFLASLLLLAVCSTQAQTPDNKPTYAVAEKSLPSFRKVIVNANIDVVLVQNDTLQKAYVEGDQKLVNQIAVSVTDGVLTIAANRNGLYRGKVQVTLSVSELAKLEINADAGVVSFSPLHTPALAIDVNGYCDLHLKSTGRILLAAGDEWLDSMRDNGNFTGAVSLAPKKG